LKEAELLILKILKQVMEEKLDENNVQLSSVTEAEGFKIYGNEVTADIIKVLKEQETEENPET
jgi:20S proteasome subunit alpha 5